MLARPLSPLWRVRVLPCVCAMFFPKWFHWTERGESRNHLYVFFVKWLTFLYVSLVVQGVTLLFASSSQVSSLISPRQFPQLQNEGPHPGWPSGAGSRQHRPGGRCPSSAHVTGSLSWLWWECLHMKISKRYKSSFVLAFYFCLFVSSRLLKIYQHTTAYVPHEATMRVK